MKLIAKTQKGTEFMHSKANAFFVSDAGANKICKIMNNTKFTLKAKMKFGMCMTMILRRKCM